MGYASISIQSPWPPMQIETISVPFCSHQRVSFSNSRTRNFVPIRSSTRPGIDSNTTNKDFAVELDPNSTSQHQVASPPNQAQSITFSRGLVFELGIKGSWDASEIGSPVVKRFVGDNEERWFMWYHGRPSGEDASDSVGLAVSGNGVHWTRGTHNVHSCGDVGCVMNCSNKWWAFDTHSIRPSEMVVMSTQLHSAVYWLYYTGYSSEEVLDHKDQKDRKIKTFKSLPGLACSQDGRHWGRIEGEHHSGALLDVGGCKDWDSMFIAGAKVVVHSSDDLRMYYHSFDAENGHYAIGMARSRDGVRWIKMGKIMERRRQRGCFDEVGVRNASVIRNHQEGNYLMAYEGIAADGRTCIGLAESPDGLKNWTRLQEEPILKPIEDDGWDSNGVGSPCLVQIKNKSEEWRLYYVGTGNDGKTGIGLAVSDGSDINKFARWEAFQC